MGMLTIAPTQVAPGPLWTTKTYMHSFVESPDGSKILYRRFADPGNQPPDVRYPDHGAQMWMTDPSFSRHEKLFDIPNLWYESGHGSESMTWLDDDRFYYNGILYSTARRSVLWHMPNPVQPRREISGWTFPAKGKFFVNVRTGSNAGFYWLDPESATVPELHPVILPNDLEPHLGGDPATYQFTYLLLSPGGSYLYFVMFTNREFGFVSNADGTGITPVGNNDMRLKPWNGHTIWLDDEHLVFPCYPEGVAKETDRFGGNQRVVGGRSNHLSVSPDGKWLVSDRFSVVLLYHYGDPEPVAELMTGEEKPLPDSRFHTHPSFSRDSKRVYYLGRKGALATVYCADISALG